MHPKLQTVIEAMPMYQTTFPDDACIIVANTEEIIGYLPGKTIDLHVQVGTKIKDFTNTVTEYALRTKCFTKEEKGPEKFGVAYIATAQPIFDGTTLIGVVSVVISNDQMNTLRLVANELSSAVEQMIATNSELTAASSDVSEQLDGLVNYADVMNQDIRHIHSIVQLVKEIAQMSKILGLNASIEAARSGEHGRGFAVVANEIQKMAQNSTESANQIASQLEHIRSSVEVVTTTTTQIASFTQQFSASMYELEGAYENITEHATKLLMMTESK